MDGEKRTACAAFLGVPAAYSHGPPCIAQLLDSPVFLLFAP